MRNTCGFKPISLSCAQQWRTTHLARALDPPNPLSEANYPMAKFTVGNPVDAARRLRHVGHDDERLLPRHQRERPRGQQLYGWSAAGRWRRRRCVREDKRVLTIHSVDKLLDRGERIGASAPLENDCLTAMAKSALVPWGGRLQNWTYAISSIVLAQ